MADDTHPTRGGSSPLAAECAPAARKPTLADALKQAKKAGVNVSGATIEDGKVSLTFGENEDAKVTPLSSGGRNVVAGLTSKACSRPTRCLKTARAGPIGITGKPASDFAVTPVRPNSLLICRRRETDSDRLAGTFNTLVRLFTLSTRIRHGFSTEHKTDTRRMLTKPRSNSRHADGSAR
jgi:hypothetical protein